MMKFTDILTNGLISYSGSTASYILGALAVAALSYLIGSVNFEVIFARSGDGLEKREKTARALAYACDFIKSALCVFIGILFMPADGFGYVAALGCMVGHSLPIYFGVKGGKCVAVLVGAMIVLSPLAAAISIIVYTLFLLFSRYVSLSTLAMAGVFPILNYYFPFSLFSYSTEEMDVPSLINFILRTALPILWAIFVCFVHVENIKRLIQGTESKAGEKNR